MTDPFADDAVTQPALPLAAIAELLAAAASTVVAELRALGGEAGWRPAPGEWSANECVGHLIEAERRGFAGRIRRILAAARDDRPFLPPDLEAWDPPAVAESRRDRLRSPDELAREFVDLRADGTALVRTMQTDDLGWTGMHPAVGPLRHESSRRPDGVPGGQHRHEPACELRTEFDRRPPRSRAQRAGL